MTVIESLPPDSRAPAWPEAVRIMLLAALVPAGWWSVDALVGAWDGIATWLWTCVQEVVSDLRFLLNADSWHLL